MSNGRVSCASFPSTQWFLVTNIGFQPSAVWFRVTAISDHRRVEFRGVGVEVVLHGQIVLVGNGMFQRPGLPVPGWGYGRAKNRRSMASSGFAGPCGRKGCSGRALGHSAAV